MTRRRLRIWNAVLTRRVKLTALLAILAIASGCSATIPDPIRLPSETAFCARYFDKDHPPIWIYESDSQSEKTEKTDLLILWERECAIRSEA